MNDSTDTSDDREELIRNRERVDAELSELGAAIDDIMAELDAMQDDTVAAVNKRDAATEAFLPDDRLPGSVSNETRDAIESYLDTLAEKRDVRSETAEMKEDRLKAENKNAADARDDIDETAAVIDRLGDRTDEAKSKVEAARGELDAARSRFENDLAVLAARFETFDIDLSDVTLETVIDEKIPERKSEIQASIENARNRVAEFSTRQSKLEKARDKLRSIDGGGTCPTCNQNVGPERTESEVEAIEEELHEVERRLGAAEQKRDELIAINEELADFRDQVIALRSFRSETVAEAAGQVEDRQENFEDLQADLEEERTELAESKAERDDADAAIATLETDVAGLEADIDRLRADSNYGEASIEAFDVVDKLRGQLEERLDELADLQEEYDEKEAELTAIDAEIEEMTE